MTSAWEGLRKILYASQLVGPSSGPRQTALVDQMGGAPAPRTPTAAAPSCATRAGAGTGFACCLPDSAGNDTLSLPCCRAAALCSFHSRRKVALLSPRPLNLRRLPARGEAGRSQRFPLLRARFISSVGAAGALGACRSPGTVPPHLQAPVFLAEPSVVIWSVPSARRGRER